MSQEQPRREDEQEELQPIKYGDLFNVEGELAEKTVAPVDAAMMQAAERNEKAGHVSHRDMTDTAAISITETHLQGRRVISESVGGQVVQQVEGKEGKITKLVHEVVEQFSQRHPILQSLSPPATTQEAGTGAGAGITIGEALEATAITAGNKPVEWSDAAAIQAAEVRATGRTNIVPGGVAAAAQSAATLNARATRDEDKTKLADVLSDATSKLPSDKAATRRDAEGVTGAEMRNDPNLTTHPAGVAASVAAAARLNQINN
ncbi:late embryogenesis abundant protein D-34-like [Senna tora]|uniref:Late embryogenesis abundant protein D-34-like n=1 Tax=Senna tora TaxID=362788 RepID=A0A834SJ61_9FABA|nr:late embryogenesis abundant protein D-34-like [Senna tora]